MEPTPLFRQVFPSPLGYHYPINTSAGMVGGIKLPSILSQGTKGRRTF